MNKEIRWTITGMMLLWASHASAQGMQTNMFVEVISYITDIVNLLYMVGVAGVVTGGIWATYKWYNTREMSEGWQGMLTVGISAAWIFFVVPKLVSFVPTLQRGG